MPFNSLAFSRAMIAGQIPVRYALASGILVFLAVFFALIPPALSQNKVLDEVTLENYSGKVYLSPFTVVQKDPELKITPQTIIDSGGRNLNGTMSSGKKVFFGFDGTPTWMIIKLHNMSDYKDWYVDFGRRSNGRVGSVSEARAYEMIVTPAQGADTTESTISINELPNRFDNGVFKISLEQNERKFLLLSVQPAPGRPTTLPLTIENEYSFLKNMQGRIIFTSTYCLTLGVFGLFFFSMAVAGKTKMPIVFGIYFFFIAMFWTTYETVGASLTLKIFTELALLYFLAFSMLLIFMAKTYFGINKNSYTEKYIIYALVWLSILSTALFYFIPVKNGIFHLLFIFGTPILILSIISLMSLAQYNNKQAPSRIYMWSCLFPLTGFVIQLVGTMNLLPQENIFINSFWYSVIPQGVFVTWAVLEKLSAKSKVVPERRKTDSEGFNFIGIRESKEKSDHTRLLKVIEREREMLAELREKEAVRMQEMQRAKDAADEANRAKSAFLAVVSHEIRTPMTGVMGMVRMLLDSSITKQQRDYALTIQESSEAMLALINDILDFEKIQRGKMEMENISFDLNRLIQGIVTLMSGHAAEKRIGLSARMDDDLPRFVKGDPTRLRQVLLNLMGNAIKFTQEGQVTLVVKNLNTQEAGQEHNPQSKHMIYFAVQDSGIGIPMESQKSLFSPFAQANSTIARKFGGTGLGLAISKGLVEAMGSAININSKENEGSTFFFTLEMDKGLAISQEPVRMIPVVENVEEKPSNPLRILVVDDNTITRKVVLNLLQKYNHEISTSSSAEEALEKIYKDAFDLVLMDIELPGMHGNDATKILRDHPDPVKSAIPVIAMTGNVQKEDMERYLADGMSGVLPKPIDPEKLVETINEIADKTYEREIRMPEDPFAMSAQEMEEKAKAQESAPASNIVFNPDMLQSLKDTIGQKQLNELLTDLILKTDEILEAMGTASKLGDYETLATRAHELKGMAGNFGLVEISSIAAQAERKAKKQETDGLSNLVGTLPDASQRAKTVLQEWSSH